jgi:hypothetical protein
VVSGDVAQAVVSGGAPAMAKLALTIFYILEEEKIALDQEFGL